MANNSDNLHHETIPEVLDNATSTSDKSNDQIRGDNPDESIDSLIQYFDQNPPNESPQQEHDLHAIIASNAQQQLNDAIKTICNKFTIKSHLSKQPSSKKQAATLVMKNMFHPPVISLFPLLLIPKSFEQHIITLSDNVACMLL